MALPFRYLFCAGLVAVAAGQAAAQACPEMPRQKATRDLMQMIDADPELRLSLEESIGLGQVVNDDPKTNPVASLEDYYDFIDALVTYNPQNIDTGIARGGIRIAMDGMNYCNWNILDMLAYSYFLVDRQITTDPRGQVQFENAAFAAWMPQVAEEWGKYLETPASAIHVPDFTDDPFFGAWYCPPAEGYDTFQAFFTRELCAETFPTASRMVEGYDDPRTVVSIGDSTSAGWWPISDDGKLITDYDTVAQSGRAIKGKLYSDVHSFILGEEGETVLAGFGDIDPSIFDGGVFTHQFLNVNNYHRLHVPVAGRLVYMRHIKAATRMKSGWVEALAPDEVSYYDPRDTADWQFGQTRLVLGIETESYGTVIATPMGMAQVSGIALRDWVQLHAHADKGWEFGNFKFGGSDFVVIFEPGAEFVLTAPQAPSVAPGAGVNYLLSHQGERYGCFGGTPDCGTEAAFPPPYPGLVTE